MLALPRDTTEADLAAGTATATDERASASVNTTGLGRVAALAAAAVTATAIGTARVSETARKSGSEITAASTEMVARRTGSATGGGATVPKV